MRSVFLIFMLVTCGCVVELPGPTHPRPEGQYRRADLWRAASGYDLDRMRVQSSDFYLPLYRTLLHTQDGATYLVCLQYPEKELFGTPYDVFIYDEDLEMVQYGEIGAQQDYEPLAVVEVRATGGRVPKDRQGEWQLAIVMMHPSKVWSEDKPLRLVGGLRVPRDGGNYAMCELIVWSWDQESRFGSGVLSDVETLEFRTAEPHFPVASDGTVLIDLKSAPDGAP